MDREEFITPGASQPIDLAPGISVTVFANGEKGSLGLTTCAARIASGAELGYHTHPTGEVITVISGEAVAMVEGRRYTMNVYDSIHIPPGVAHGVKSESSSDAVLHTCFPTETPSREFVDDEFETVDRDETDDSCPESLRRIYLAERYGLASGMEAYDLFAGRFGSKGVCGGYAMFHPGAGLPCHIHEYDESITIVSGTATCQVAGKTYELSDFDTACIPKGRPHRFLNEGEEPMEMIWVYAGDEPDRVVVDQCRCDESCKKEML